MSSVAQNPKEKGGLGVFQKMEHLPEWAFCFLHCDPKNGGKNMQGNMPSNCTKKIGAGLHNPVETLIYQAELRLGCFLTSRPLANCQDP